MSGMAPFDEVSQLLKISLDEEFETLSGFLISLIGKIPGDNEQFDLEYQGWKFQVQSVRDKMIHTVLVLKIPDENQETRRVQEEKG